LSQVRTEDACLGPQQPVEERAVTLQGDAQVLGRDLVPAIPLLLELMAPVGEAFSKSLHQACDQGVGLFDRLARLIDEAGLDDLPPPAEVISLLRREQRLET
jgi:hypothetical protein